MRPTRTEINKKYIDSSTQKKSLFLKKDYTEIHAIQTICFKKAKILPKQTKDFCLF